MAETNRVPFDLPEAESELVAGFHTEYSSFKFAMFFIAEYTSMITVSCLCTIMFFGGWLSPFPTSWTFTYWLPSIILIPFGLWVIWDGIRYETILGRIILPLIGGGMAAIGAALILLPGVNEYIQAPFWFLSKVFVFLFVYVWMRGTLPRFRYDQLMDFGWKLLLPVSIVNLIVTSFIILLREHHPMTPQLIVFFVLAALAVIGAISLILQSHPIHSALSLIVVMVALAGLYLLMGAEFVAAVQIIVYGGAIMVLFVFVIMLLNAGAEEHTNLSKLAGVLWDRAGHCAGWSGGGRDCAVLRRHTDCIAAWDFDFDARSFAHAVSGFRLSLRANFLSDPCGHYGRGGSGAEGEIT